MKKFYYLALMALVGLAFSSCNLAPNTPQEFKLTDLQHLWLEDGDTTVGHYVRFTTEQSDEAGYLLGREWTTSQDKSEQDLLDAREILGHPGNGWFKYQFVTKDGGLVEIHLMDNQGAELPDPERFIVSKLTDTDLEYYENGNKSWNYKFTRVVEL